MATEPQFKVQRTTTPREFMGEVYVDGERVVKRLVRAKNEMKALAVIQGIYQSMKLQGHFPEQE